MCKRKNNTKNNINKAGEKLYNEKYVYENLKNAIMRVKDRVYRKIIDLDTEIYTSKEPLPFEKRYDGVRRSVKVGDKWGDLFDCAWFHCTAKLPKVAKNKKIVFVIDINGEGLVFDDEGCPVRAITNKNSIFDRKMGNPGKRIVSFKENASGGEEIDFWMDAGCNDLTGNLQDDGRIRELYVAECNDIARELFYDLIVLYVQSENTPSDDPVKYELLNVLSKCRKIFISFSDEEMLECLKITKERLSLKGGDSPALTLTAFGHAHIDLAWLWPLRETRRKGGRTFATAIDNMGRYPDYRFGASQPQLYEWVKTDYPKLYDKVKKAHVDNRWELLGAMWSEPDLNLISGESVIRQILYGNNFWKKEFGQKVNFVWTPDTFGYSAALPQIFKKSGIDFFATIKMSWNLINVFPYVNFKWRGIDGSEILVHMPPEGNYLSEGTAKSVLNIKRRMVKSGQFGEALLPFGIGDGGGGPSPSHLEYLKREENLPGLCPIKQGKMADFFERMREKSADLPVWNGELYLERHLGVYTSAARNKMYNRFMEYALRDAETLSAIAMRKVGYSYPQNKFEEIWKEVLLYQFHDILPGSSIQRVYDESLKRYEILYSRVNELKNKAAEALAAKISVPANIKSPAIIFNTLSFERTYDIKTENGIVTVNLPPMGYCIADISDYKVSRMDSLENEYLKVTILEDGSIGSIYNKKIGEELLREPSNILYIYDDIENAWNLQYDYRNQQPERAEFCDTEVQNGNCGMTVIQKYRYHNSEIVLKLSLGPNDKVLKITADLDWHEKHKMLRIAFVTDVDTDSVKSETQFGYVNRSSKYNNSYEQAQIETVAHRWIALCRPGLNFALLNDCKYGYSAKDNIIELNAIRGTDYPATNLDFGSHTFCYGIYSDKKNDLTDVIKNGYMFNFKPVVCEAANKGDGVTHESFLGTDKENVFIDGVKKAENSDDLIIRSYEAVGKKSNTAILSSLEGHELRICNLAENDIGLAKEKTEYGPFEIITYSM